jgi:PAS domain S-box-containing protein
MEDTFSFMRLEYSLRSYGWQIQKEAAAEIDTLSLAADRIGLVVYDLDTLTKKTEKTLKHILTRLKDTPFIALAGPTSVDAIHKAQRYGVDHLIIKPFADKTINEVIRRAKHRFELWDQNQRLQQQLDEVKQGLQMVVDHSDDLIYTLDRKGRFTFVNPPAAADLGYRPADLMGRHYQTVVLDEDIPKAKWRFNERRTGLRATSDFPLRLKPGPLTTSERKNGQSHAPVRLSAVGIYQAAPGNDEQSHLGTWGVIRNLANNRVNRLNAYLPFQWQSAGLQAYGMVHDFNNLLMGIQSNTMLMLNKMQKSHPLMAHVQTIDAYARDGNKLIRHFLAPSTNGRLKREALDILQFIKRHNRLFQQSHQNITLKENLDPITWPVKADPIRLGQVLLNLYLNAQKAMPDGGEIFTATSNIQFSDSYPLVRRARLKAGRYIRIDVADTGVGMQLDDQEKIFDLFFSSRPNGHGNGIGLHLSYLIVQRHGGHIQVRSTPGNGTLFTIFLPAASSYS